MNIFSRITWKTLWRNRVRTIVTVVGIILSTAMFMAVCTMGVSLWDFMVRGAVMDYGDYFARYDFISQEEYSSLAEDDRVDKIFDSQTIGYFQKYVEVSDWYVQGVVSAVDAEYFEQIGIGLTQGRFPQTSSEIVVPEELVHNISENGLQIGQAITLELHSRIPVPPEGLSQPETDTVMQKAFTVVGFSSGTRYRMIQDDLDMASFFVLADGNLGQPLWHRAFIQCAPRDSLKLADHYDDPRLILNNSLLNFYGITGFDNTNTAIIAFLIILCAIIMVGTVSLIYNAFSISVSQRIRQFGLLRSIGATKRQLRRAVFTEALYLCAIGIPLGLISGYGGIAVTMRLLRNPLNTYLSMNSGAVTLQPVFSWWALGGAAVIALVTVLLSASIPARRATHVSPMDAIRQTQEYQAGTKPIRCSYLTKKLFGLSGILAKKYYTISRSKYRATVASLAISIILFISSVGFVQNFKANISATVTVQNYDIECYDCKDMEQLRSQSFVSKSAYTGNESFRTWINPEEFSQDALDFKRILTENNIYTSYFNTDATCNPYANMTIYYLEDAVLRDHLLSQGIDPAPYFQEDPLALVLQKKGSVYIGDGENNAERYSFSHALLAGGVEELAVFDNTVPNELSTLLPEGVNSCGQDVTFDSSGDPVVRLRYFDPALSEECCIYLAVRQETNQQGQQVIAYYQRSTLDSQDASQAIAYDVPQRKPIRLGAVAQELPFGIGVWAQNPVNVALVLPLSAHPDGVATTDCLMFNVSDHAAAVEWLEQQGARYVDNFAAQESDRTILLVVQVFSYGFIVLISLIAASNVFNTVSTNIQLRRRDFGTLKSVGMTKHAMRKMLVLECLTYGAKALLYGLPLSIGICWAIYRQTIHRTTFEAFTPPWGAIAIAVASVFAVVFASMLYASRKLSQQDPIAAIRQENI